MNLMRAYTAVSAHGMRYLASQFLAATLFFTGCQNGIAPGCRSQPDERLDVRLIAPSEASPSSQRVVASQLRHTGLGRLLGVARIENRLGRPVYFLWERLDLGVEPVSITVVPALRLMRQADTGLFVDACDPDKPTVGLQYGMTELKDGERLESVLRTPFEIRGCYRLELAYTESAEAAAAFNQALGARQPGFDFEAFHEQLLVAVSPTFSEPPR